MVISLRTDHCFPLGRPRVVVPPQFPLLLPPELSFFGIFSLVGLLQILSRLATVVTYVVKYTLTPCDHRHNGLGR